MLYVHLYVIWYYVLQFHEGDFHSVLVRQHRRSPWLFQRRDSIWHMSYVNLWRIKEHNYNKYKTKFFTSMSYPFTSLWSYVDLGIDMTFSISFIPMFIYSYHLSCYIIYTSLYISTVSGKLHTSEVCWQLVWIFFQAKAVDVDVA